MLNHCIILPYLRISYSFSHGSALQFMVRLGSGLGLRLSRGTVSELWTEILTPVQGVLQVGESMKPQAHYNYQDSIITQQSATVI